MMMKGIELGKPEAMLEVFRLHSELLYHPSPSVVTSYFEHFKAAGFDKLKPFFLATKGNYLMFRPKGFHLPIIEQAYASKDRRVVIQAYLDILDYETSGLTAQHLQMVYDSFDYELAIDHALVVHLSQTAKKLGL